MFHTHSSIFSFFVITIYTLDDLYTININWLDTKSGLNSYRTSNRNRNSTTTFFFTKSKNLTKSSYIKPLLTC